MEQVKNAAAKAKEASRALGILGVDDKNAALLAIARALIDNTQYILDNNRLDVDGAKARGVTSAMIDRLSLNEARVKAMADGMLDVAALPDPVGEVINMVKRPNGLLIGKRRVPMGVVGIIYEARPNVTADAIGLCLKTGNAVVLRGGSEAINSNKAIVSVAKAALRDTAVSPDAVALIENTDREAATYMMTLNGLMDVLIPRGGAGLIQSVVKNATVPVIETGVGNCHVYVDEFADLDMAAKIIFNAKTSRPAVCNAAETLLVHAAVADHFLPMAKALLDGKNVELRGCERTAAVLPDVKPATEEDYRTEFLDYILAIKVVDSLDEAVAHITRYGTGHSETIVTESYTNANAFLDRVDAAAVYVNASTRYTDGGEFGFGAEIGISTQKLHARGPMGLTELTTIKYVIFGNGQTR